MAEQRLRWQALFQRADEPLFVLNRKRAIAYVNPAWERLTGVSALDARHFPCRQRHPASPTDSMLDILGHVLCPPGEVLLGQACSVRRLIPTSSGAPRWWEIEFTPFRENNKPLVVLGRILAQVVPTASSATAPLPERLMTLRHQARARREVAFPRGENPAQQRLAEQVRLAASVSCPAILVGEPGSGKRTLAGLIHQRGSQRERALAVLDCQRLPTPYVVDMLFGNAALAQRGQLGTLYLREPGALPREVQTLLCQKQTTAETTTEAVLPRLLAGFDTEPLEQVRQGKLLNELFCCLAPLRLDINPLRQRLDELPLLVDQILARLNSPGDKVVSRVQSDVWELLRGYSWQGNFRELIAVLDQARQHAAGDSIAVGDLPFDFRVKQMPPTSVTPPRTLSLDGILEQVERRLIVLTLERCRGNKSKAAGELGLSRGRFLRRLEILGMDEPPILDLIEE